MTIEVITCSFKKSYESKGNIFVTGTVLVKNQTSTPSALQLSWAKTLPSGDVVSLSKTHISSSGEVFDSNQKPDNFVSIAPKGKLILRFNRVLLPSEATHFLFDAAPDRSPSFVTKIILVEDLLPPNATPLEKCLALTAASRQAELSAQVVTLWKINECPEQLLPWLAWLLSLDQNTEFIWRSDTKTFSPASLAEIRNFTMNSVKNHRIKGTLEAVKKTLNEAGIPYLRIEEWWGTFLTGPAVIAPTLGDSFSIELDDDVITSMAEQLKQHPNPSIAKEKVDDARVELFIYDILKNALPIGRTFTLRRKSSEHSVPDPWPPHGGGDDDDDDWDR